MNKGKGRGSGRNAGGPRVKPEWPASQSVVRALLRRQALGRKGRLPSSHGLPKAPARLVYSMSNVIPVGQRHDRVILGFTADGEHLMCCCGPVANPSRLELRRVRLQWPGLSRPGEALWSLPLKVRGGGGSDTLDHDEASEGIASEGDIREEEEEEEDEDDEHGLGMDGMGSQEPASVAITESADGFLVVAVVSLRHNSSHLHEDDEEEDRVYRVFVAPGPSYVAAVRNACVEHPFSGVAFSYIVPAGGGQGGGGGGAPVPSIAAHDVGAVGAATGGAGGRAGEERVYVIVVNAVDAIRAVEVRLHTDDARTPPSSRAHISTTGERGPRPPRAKFTLRPPTPPGHLGKRTGGGGGDGGGLGGGGDGTGCSGSSEGESGGGGGGGGDGAGGRRGGGARGDGGVGAGDGSSGSIGTGSRSRSRSSSSSSSSSSSNGSSSFDPSSVWWACGRDLSASPLVGTRPLPYRRTVAGGGGVAVATRAEAVPAAGAAEPGQAARGGGGAVVAEPALPSRSSVAAAVEGEGMAGGYDGSRFSSSNEATAGGRGGGGGGGRVTGTGTGNAGGELPAAAAPRALAAPTAQARRRRRGRRRAHASADRGRQRVLDLEVLISQLLLRREAFPDPSDARQPQPQPPSPMSTPTPIPTPSRKRKSSGGCCGPGGASSGGAPSVLATDYHCVTIGLMDGGRRVLLCLVVEVLYTGNRNRNGGRGGGGGTGGDSRGAPRTKDADAGDGGGGGAGVLGFVLALDLECGEVAVLDTRSGPGRGKRCAFLCETLARSVRRGGAFLVDRPGRRLSNTNVVQGRSLGAIVNPVYPVAIVMGGGCDVP